MTDTKKDKVLYEYFVAIAYDEPLHGVVSIAATNKVDAAKIVRRQMSGRKNVRVINTACAKDFVKVEVDTTALQEELFPHYDA